MKTILEDQSVKRDVTLKILNRVTDLPYDYDSVNDVLYLLKDSNANFIQLAKAIQRDHALFIKTLSAANSIAEKSSKKVYTIERAISLLGLENIEKIVRETLQNSSMKMDDRDSWYRNKFWRHSIFVANTAKSLSEEINYRESSNSFTAGYLHDIGVFVIWSFFPQEYQEIKKLVEEDEIPFLKAEKIVLGSSHTEIAKLMMNRWNLPGEITKAVSNHHNPSDSGEEIILSSIVHLADFVTHWIGINQNHWDAGIDFDESIIHILMLNDANISEQIPFAVNDIIKDILQSKNRSVKNHFQNHEPVKYYS